MVFFDLHVSSPDGLEALRWKQTQTQLARIVVAALSGSEDLGEVENAYEAGANTFLAKPLQKADLRNLVEAFPGGAGLWLRGFPVWLPKPAAL